jgi:hypothetical protein
MRIVCNDGKIPSLRGEQSNPERNGANDEKENAHFFVILNSVIASRLRRSNPVGLSKTVKYFNSIKL